MSRLVATGEPSRNQLTQYEYLPHPRVPNHSIRPTTVPDWNRTVPANRTCHQQCRRDNTRAAMISSQHHPPGNIRPIMTPQCRAVPCCVRRRAEPSRAESCRAGRAEPSRAWSAGWLWSGMQAGRYLGSRAGGRAGGRATLGQGGRQWASLGG